MKRIKNLKEKVLPLSMSRRNRINISLNSTSINKSFTELAKREFSTSLRFFKIDLSNLRAALGLDKLIKKNDSSISHETIKGVTEINFDSKMIYDGSNSKDIKDRVGNNGIYKVYNILLDEQEVFINSLTDILEEIYDNNEFSIFRLYFLLKPDFKRVQKYDLPELINHLSKYPQEVLNNEITKVHKNTGLIITKSILVWLSLYDENNLLNISRKIKKDMKENINRINKTIKLDFNNNRINFNKKVETNSELILVITADFTNENMINNREDWEERKKLYQLKKGGFGKEL